MRKFSNDISLTHFIMLAAALIRLFSIRCILSCVICQMICSTRSPFASLSGITQHMFLNKPTRHPSSTGPEHPATCSQMVSHLSYRIKFCHIPIALLILHTLLRYHNPLVSYKLGIYLLLMMDILILDYLAGASRKRLGH